MARLTALLLAICIASVYTQCTIDKAQSYYKRSIYEFTVKLADRISHDTDGHFIASGLSPWNLLSIASIGATEETLAEIASVLRIHPHKCFQDKYNEIVRQIITFTNSTVLEHSAAILVDQNLDVTEFFVSETEKANICSLELLDFNDAVSTAAFVNDLVKSSTHEAIQEIITANDLQNAKMLMIDAIYFKGVWRTQFPYSETEVSAFYNERGNQVGDVNLMFVNGIFNVTSVKQLQARVLELPYGEEDRISMLIFLPYPDRTINTLIHDLSLISLKTIISLFQRHEAEKVAVQLPRFKILSDLNNLKELMMDMGLRKMFDGSEASFNNLASQPLHVANLIQQAQVDVTEDGTVASAVSEAEFESRVLPDQFVVNRPFVFMIVDKSVEVPIFIGAYSIPSVV